MPLSCPASSLPLLDDLEAALSAFTRTARRAIQAGDVQPTTWHTTFWSIGFERDKLYGMQMPTDGGEEWETILSAPTAHGTLALRERYAADLETALDHLVAFRDGLGRLHPALRASLDRLGGFHLRLDGGLNSPMTWTSGPVMAPASAQMKLHLPRHDTIAPTRRRWEKALSLSARLDASAPLFFYRAQGVPVAAPDAPSAVVLVGALLNLDAATMAGLPVYKEEDQAQQAKAVRALLRRRNTTI